MKSKSFSALLAAFSLGRVLLHLQCALRDHHWRWHGQGILRELKFSLY